MNSTGQSGEKSGYLVILLLVVGLAAFSSAMKELRQLHQFALDAGSMVAQWSSDTVAPTEIPFTVTKLETCESRKTLEQSVPSVELPWLKKSDEEEETSEIEEIEPPVVAERSRRDRVRRSNSVRRVDFHPVKLEVSVSTDHDAEPDVVISPELPQFTFKAKTRKHNLIRITPRDREVFLKTLNRSINLRIAS